MIIEDLIFLLFSFIAVAILGLFAYLLIFIVDVYDKSKEKKQRRAEIRSDFKREINEIRNDNWVYTENYERGA